ncbi:MAG: hypothetical protein ABR584_09410 [Candidatus Baltobacteraceae bacterium]
MKLAYTPSTEYVFDHPAPHDTSILGDIFERDAFEMLRFSRHSWLPELRASFVQLATAIRAKDLEQVRFFTHRIRGCAAMGGAQDIVCGMNDVSRLASEGQWAPALSRFRHANYALGAIAKWVAHELGNIAS